MHRFRHVLVCLVLVASGCASGAGAGPVASVAEAKQGSPTERFSGFYEVGWEKEAFRPCGTQEEWWSWSTGKIIEEDPRGWGRAFVVLEGEVSPPGSYGHLGQYRREIVITRVIEVRAAPGAECPLSL
ncbi:MAG: hypothetical protein H0X52_01300 [Gemmatimonadetes bacterium]|nr:hypothetical protein [Gemmatimonadota bacterium]